MKGLIKMIFPDAAIISYEVHDTIEAAAGKSLKLRSDCSMAYCTLQYKFDVEEDYATSNEWVVGKIQADMASIKKTIQENVKGCNFDKLWDVLTSNNLVKVEGDIVMLPLLMRKMDLINETKKTLERWEKTYEDFLKQIKAISKDIESTIKKIDTTLTKLETN